MLLKGGRAREHDHGWRGAEADEIAGKGGEIAQQAAETVHRAAFGGGFAGGLVLGVGRDLAAAIGEGLAAAAGRS